MCSKRAPIVYAIVLVGASFYLGAIIGGGAYILALILAWVAWTDVYKSTFRTGSRALKKTPYN